MNYFSYSSVLKELYAINLHSGMQLGLKNIQNLCSLFGNPEKAFPAIVVAGTNGKGSVTTKIATTLALSGYKVGLYTSPHISSFRERIRINGKEISEDAVCVHLQRIFEQARTKQIEATFFEYVTLLAYLYFAQESVDVAVLEVGLGGALDATNVASTIVSVITSISLDHTRELGATTHAIAKEKAGIMKRGVPVVIGPNVPVDVIYPIAQQLSCPLHTVVAFFKNVEEENCAVAKKTIECLPKPFSVTDSALEKGLQALPACRFESVDQEKLSSRFGKKIPKATILDVGHNSDAMAKLVVRLQDSFPNTALHFVYGASKDKDIQACLRELAKGAEALHFVQADHPRAESVEALENLATQIGLREKVASSKTINEGVSAAFTLAANEGAVLVICGSFFIMQQTRCTLGYVEPVDCLNLNENLSKEKYV